MKLRIVAHGDADREEWNSLVNGSGSGWAYHLYDAIGVPWREGKNLSFGIRDDDRGAYLLVAQLHILSVEEWGEQFHVLKSRWGFCWADKLGKKDFRGLAEAFKSHIDGLYRRWDIREFSVELPPMAARWAPDRNETVNPLMDFGFAPGIRYTYVVDLEKEDGRVLADCQQTTRNEIHRMEKTGKYHMERAPTGEEGLREWWALHLATFARTGGAPLSEAYARNVILQLVPQGICDIFDLKDTKGVVVANVTVMKHGGTAYYLWGNSVDGREPGVNKYLLYLAIMAFKQETERQGLGHRWFETGGAHPYLRDGKDKGISDYKKCFGTRMHVIWRGWYVAPADRLIVHPTIWMRVKWKAKLWGKRFLENNRS